MSVILAVEDGLAQAVAERLVRDYCPGLNIGSVLGGSGKGYLRTKARDLNRTAGSVKVLLLIDQDSPGQCPQDIIDSWLGSGLQPNMLFRIAVTEVESWVLADRSGCASLIGIPTHRIPHNTDTIANAKEFVVQLARRSSRREVRADLLPLPGSTATVGPNYNPLLTNFVATEWDTMTAADHSDSLRRAILRLSRWE